MADRRPSTLIAAPRPPFEKHRRVDAAGDLLQVLHDLGQARRRAGQLRLECWQLRGHTLSATQREGEGEEALLRAVVQIPFDAAARLVGGGDDTCTRGREVGRGSLAARSPSC